MKLRKSNKRVLVILIMIMSLMVSSISFTHSGRTDGNGGHKDNNNKSGLGYYHYHHGYGPHLHTDGVCPYTTSSSSSSTTNSSTSSSSSTVTSTNTVSDTTYVIVSIPEFDVTVNGQLLDIKHSQYPVLLYNNVTYFPMTSDYLSGIGLTLDFSAQEGLSINNSDSVGVLQQNFLGSYNTLGREMNAQLASFGVKVNGQTINNKSEDYPVLLYKDITYFPMTWRFAVTEFGWSTDWSDANGFEIVIEK